ncbi:MAG: xanthine dehydrogenase family protein molybdopterin-binding subunit, partial [Pseudomonadota bacterium]|nr:xanthine dehydrogenase family protein molybdopterin-binding subunit [Pseudomonadota bacterium]
MGEYGISQSLSRFEDPRLLKGGGDYIDDGNENSQLYGVVVRSPHSHAEIASIDVSKARALDGVVGVYTGRDYQEAGWGAIPHIGPAVKRRNGADLIVPDFYPLALDRVRMVGEGVAFVVAETEIQARDAAERVITNYVPLQGSADTMTALEPDTSVLWPDIGDNEALVHEIGDKSATERAFALADHVIEQRFTINRVLGNAMEIRA